MDGTCPEFLFSMTGKSFRIEKSLRSSAVKSSWFLTLSVEADSRLELQTVLPGFGGLGGLEHLVGVVVTLSGEKEEGNCLLPLDLITISSGETGLVSWLDWMDIEFMLREGRLV